MMKQEVPTLEMKGLVDYLWKRYPNGFVANIKKGEVPQIPGEIYGVSADIGPKNNPL